MLATPGVRSVLSVVIAWMLAHNVLYTYIVPFLAPAGLAVHADRILLLFGVSTLVGIWLTSRTVDHALRGSVLISLAVFAVAAASFLFGTDHPLVVMVGTAV